VPERGATAKTTANITIKFNGDEISRLKVDETNNDILQLVDLKERSRKGDNTILLEF